MRRREVIDVAPDQSSLRNTLPPVASKDFVRWRPSTEHFGSTPADLRNFLLTNDGNAQFLPNLADVTLPQPSGGFLNQISR